MDTLGDVVGGGESVSVTVWLDVNDCDSVALLTDIVRVGFEAVVETVRLLRELEAVGAV